jgi:hypothetical protein
MLGWIKIHRQINNHWTWEKPEYLKWWIDILIEANFTHKKVLIKGQLIEVNRGDVIYSYETWAKRWKTNKSKVMRFLKLLEKDSMILLKNETVTTRITICNYDTYQSIEVEDETQVLRKRKASVTQVNSTKEGKKETMKESITINNIEIIDFSRLGAKTFRQELIQLYSLEEFQFTAGLNEWSVMNTGTEFTDEKHLKRSLNLHLKNNSAALKEIKKERNRVSKILNNNW